MGRVYYEVRELMENRTILGIEKRLEEKDKIKEFVKSPAVTAFCNLFGSGKTIQGIHARCSEVRSVHLRPDEAVDVQLCRCHTEPRAFLIMRISVHGRPARVSWPREANACQFQFGTQLHRIDG